MKTITLISLATLSLIYATAQNSTSLEYEHQLKSSSSVESPVEDMSKMKAMGKCGADQKAGKPVVSQDLSTESKASLVLEHAVKTPSSDESPVEDMSKMKAMGKCGADQKAGKPVVSQDSSTESKASLVLEHAVKTPSSDESPVEDMSKMKAMGKCGGGK
jgi:hypothetical protein